MKNRVKTGCFTPSALLKRSPSRDIYPASIRVKYARLYPLWHHSGFTLMELLVSLLIFAILAAMAYGGLQVVLDAKKRTETHAVQLAKLQTFFAIMSRDIEQMIDRGIRDNYGQAQPSLTGDGTTLEFTRTGWRNPAGFVRSHMQRVAYVLEDQEITRLGWQVLDRAQGSAPMENMLIDHVNELDVRFLDQDLLWQSQWPVLIAGSNNAPAGLPRAVEVVVDIEGWGRITRLFSVVGGMPVPAPAAAPGTPPAATGQS